MHLPFEGLAMSKLNGRLTRLERNAKATGTANQTEWIDVQGERWQVIHGQGCRILLPDNGRGDATVFDPIHNGPKPIAIVTAEEWNEA